MMRKNLVLFGFAGLVSVVAAQMACSPVGRRGSGDCDVFSDPACDDTSSGAGGKGSGSSSSGGDGGDIIFPPPGTGGSAGG
ncbi:MAG TPA: hypothetical protein PKA58_33160, partial [Polyangium sp.]|nr:hypothetical protein [Polyangium sp.]